MTNDDRGILLVDALKRLRRIERRLIGFHSASLNATKHADRLVLANDADALRLEIDTVYGLIENELDQQAREALTRFS